MSIQYEKQQKIFHLKAGGMSYAMQVVRGRYLAHLYWGRGLRAYDGSRFLIQKERVLEVNPEPGDKTFSLGTLPQEYPQYGNGDFRSCAFCVRDEAGSRVSSLSYQGYAIEQGKPGLPGLPASFGGETEAETLRIHMRDEAAGLDVYLLYSVFEKENVIARSVCFENHSQRRLILEKMMSVSLDIREDDFDVLTLYGAHNNERNPDRRHLKSGAVQIESLRGVSSPQQSPFMALLRKGTDENQGEVFAANFVYSGNFLAQAQADVFGNTRFQMGMNPWNGEWLLEPGESFQTPEVLLVYSDKGMNGMSHTFHRFIQNHLVRSPFAGKERPILINSWEAAYFDFTQEKLLELARRAKEAGIELFVLDDGWFGKRNDEDCSLGDWYENREKLPQGLCALEKRIHGMGMKFGLWVEPEMISEDSELYRTHPDYVLHTEGRPYTYGRRQLVLDLYREEVCSYVLDAMERVLSLAEIDYIKWDMNRHLTDVGSAFLPPERQGEVFHRYVLGLYWILERLTANHSEVLFESCSSGGGRFDAGMLYYMPQTWCSDNTDPVCRTRIQYATSLLYPPVTMGAHVSASPNHQTGRISPLSTRGHAAMSANFGCELDLTKCTEEELAEIAEQVRFYKEIRNTVQRGSFYRLENPFEGNTAAWEFVSEDGREVLAFRFEILCRPNAPVRILKLIGLEEGARYRNAETGEIYGGDELMYSGLSILPEEGDFRSRCFRLWRV